jgi:alpha-mannosidase
LNEPYQYSYLFAYVLQVPAGAKTLTLPKNEKVRVFAVSVAEANPQVTVAQPVYDMLGRTPPGLVE